MQETIDTLFEIYESTAVCNFDNWSGNNLTNRISFFDCIPRIFFKLLETKRNSLAVQIPAKNLCFDNITNVDNFFRVGNSLCPRKFGDVSKTFDTRFNFDKYTEVSNLCNRSLYNITNVILLVEC